jgi:FKBP-type peptidyl-prolyl cis-trans isomerase
MRSLRSLALVAALALGATACGGDDSGSGSTSGSGSCEITVSKDMKKKPEITIPDCATKPTDLKIVDIVEGSGPEAKVGGAVAAQYVGKSWSTKEQFDASWDHGGQPFTVAPLGQAGVIQGWNEGLVGMKQGGRRLLIIPPDKGYGPSGQGPIGPNETLVFVVDAAQVG